jgi:hypothetical protein
MSEAPRVPMSDPLLSTLVAILDIVVLERLHGGSFRQLGTEHPPSWFSEAFHSADTGAPVTLVQAFPVLDSFLSEAEVFWQRTAYGRLDGEAFVVAGSGGHNLALMTIAVALQGRHFLLIQRVAGFDERQQVLQRAREQALSHEAVVRKIDGLRQPFSKLTACADELAASGLSQAQGTVMARARAELEALGRLLDELPKLPPAASPAGRSRRS